MNLCTVHFAPTDQSLQVPAGTLIHDAASQAGISLNMPCGGQGRCGRCAVQVEEGRVRRRSTLRLSPQEIAQGFALACQTVVEGDVHICVPPQERIQRRLTTDRTATEMRLPWTYDLELDQPIRVFYVELDPPTLDDQTDDWSRLARSLRREFGLADLVTDLAVLRKVGPVLRQAEWQVTAVVELDRWDRPTGPARLLDLLPGRRCDRLLGAAIDIGTTSNVVNLVDLVSGRVLAKSVDYNGQISRGEDVISRIIYASKGNGLGELQGLVLQTLNRLLAQAAEQVQATTDEIYAATITGNTTMIHLFLGLPPESIRLSPFIPLANRPFPASAGEVGLNLHPQAAVDCLPGVGSYVGADISAGAVSSGLTQTDKLTLFLDVGTNGETVLGNQEWLITCACSAGPAFEGAGVGDGMRATTGAIEEVWVHGVTHEPTYRVIGNKAPQGICGSGLIALLAELFVTGVVDRGGHLRRTLGSNRVREGGHGPEYVVAWAAETAHGQDIVLNEVDIDNLLRAKAAIYAGFTVMCESVGVELDQVEQLLVGGAFGQYLNIEKAIQIGLLPDLAWDRFHFLGNTSVHGAVMALLSRRLRNQIGQAADKMTYLELSADNSFYDNFMSALFLPHTEVERFPSVIVGITD